MPSIGDLTLNIILNSNGVVSGTASVTGGLNSIRTAEQNVQNETNNLNRIFSSTGSTISNISTGFAKFGLAITGIQALVGLLKSTFGDWVRMAEGAEVATAKLANGLKNVGEGADAMRLLRAQSDALRNVTPFSRSDITNAQAMLTTFKKSSEEIAILTPRILDLSAAFMKNGESEMDVQRVALMLGKVNEETLGTLRRYGVAFTSAEGEVLKSLQGVEQATYLAKILDSNFKNMAVTVGQTTAGQFKIMENRLNALKASISIFISDAIRPLITPLGQLFTMLSNSPTYFKTAALAVGILGAAFMTIGKNMSLETKAFILIAALIQALPPDLRLAAGAVMVLAGAMVYFNGTLSVMNVTLGGLPVVLGLIATGLTGIITGISGMKDTKSFQEITDELNKQNDVITTHQANIDNLKNIQQQLANQSNLNASQQSELNNQISEAIKLYPQLITGVDEHTGALTTNDAALQETIKSETELNDIRRQKLMADEVKQINDLITAHGEEISNIRKLKSNIEDLNSYQNNKQGWLSRLINGDKNSEIEIVAVQQKISGMNNEIINASQYSADLQLQIDNAVKQGLKFGTLKEVISQLKPSISGNTEATNIFFRVMSQNLNMAISGWDDLLSKIDYYNNQTKVVGPPAPQARTPDYLQEQISNLDKQIGQTAEVNKIRELQKQKEELDKERKNLLGENTKPARRVGTRSVRETIDETDAADELIKTWQRLIDIYHTADDARKEEGLSELEVINRINDEISKDIYNQDQLIKLDKFRKDLWSNMKFTPDVTANTEDPILKRIQADVEAAREAYNKKSKYGKDQRFDPFDEVEAYRQALELEKKIADVKLSIKDYEELIKDAKERQSKLDLNDYDSRKKYASLIDDIKNYEKAINDIIDKRKTIENDIHTKSIENINDEFIQKKAKIQQEYELELDRIRKLEDATPRQKSDLIRLAGDTRERELRDNDRDRRDKIDDTRKKAFNESLDIADAISSKLGDGASKIVSSFREAYNFVIMITELLKTINLLSSLLNFIPGAGAVAATPAGGASPLSISGNLPGTPFISRFSNNIPASMPIPSDITIIPQGELTDHLTYKIVAKGTIINNVKIANSTL